MKMETIEQLSTVGARTTGAGASVGLYGWLASSQFLGMVGAAIALVGLLVNWYYKRQSNIRSRHIYLLQVERLKRGTDPITDFSQLEADE